MFHRGRFDYEREHRGCLRNGRRCLGGGERRVAALPTPCVEEGGLVQLNQVGLDQSGTSRTDRLYSDGPALEQLLSPGRVDAVGGQSVRMRSCQLLLLAMVS